MHENRHFKNQDNVALNPLVPLFGRLVAHSARISADRQKNRHTYTHTHTHTHKPSTATLAAYARRELAGTTFLHWVNMLTLPFMYIVLLAQGNGSLCLTMIKQLYGHGRFLLCMSLCPSIAHSCTIFVIMWKGEQGKEINVSHALVTIPFLHLPFPDTETSISTDQES